MASYAFQQVLVSTEWVSHHLNDPLVRMVEVNEQTSFYARSHIPGAIELDCNRDLHHPVQRDITEDKAFEAFCSANGIGNHTTVVLYGNRNNGWACYAFWVFKLFGHLDVRVMDGGREKWMAENRPHTQDLPHRKPEHYTVQTRYDESLRVFRDDVMRLITEGGATLVDVRTPDEYSGKRVHLPFYPNEGAVRGGHIPTAINIPWDTAFHDDATFRSYEELCDLYADQGVSEQSDVIAYCRIGERSAVTWFVLTYLLGFPNVRSYDGGWLEWGNTIRLPIQKVP